MHYLLSLVYLHRLSLGNTPSAMIPQLPCSRAYILLGWRLFHNKTDSALLRNGILEMQYWKIGMSHEFPERNPIRAKL